MSGRSDGIRYRQDTLRTNTRIQQVVPRNLRIALSAVLWMLGALVAVNCNLVWAAEAPHTKNRTISECAKALMAAGPNSIEGMGAASDLCYKQIYNQALINDFLIRRSRYVEQAFLDKVLLWMVVIITLSGVVLSGVQLLASYKLATGGKTDLSASGTVSVEKDKITLQSSVIGLFILVISLAFFIIYVYGVYTIKVNQDDSIANIGGIRGGLGPPPAGGKAEP